MAKICMVSVPDGDYTARLLKLTEQKIKPSWIFQRGIDCIETHKTKIFELEEENKFLVDKIARMSEKLNHTSSTLLSQTQQLSDLKAKLESAKTEAVKANLGARE